MSAYDDELTTLIREIAGLSRERGLTVAVAESVTAGRLSSALCAGEEASHWFRGGVVAYSPHAKSTLLGVPPGPLITPDCAQTMARGVAERLDADVAVATTGVGGPDPVEGHPPGTVWFGHAGCGRTGAECRQFDGDVEAVIDAAVLEALHLLRDELRGAPA